MTPEKKVTTKQIDSFNQMAVTIHDLAIEKGWYDKAETDDQFMARACSNLHGEVSELWEAHRAGNLFTPCDKNDKLAEAGIDPMTCAEEELADIIIRAMDTAGRLGINLGEAVARKHLFNTTRPYRHGGKKA